MAVKIDMIRSSFELLKSAQTDVAERFYLNLFKDYPRSLEVFGRFDKQTQKMSLFNALSKAIENLDKPDELTRFLLDMGERHVAIGCKDAHHAWVGTTLQKTLSEFFGNRWTNELSSQWGDVYNILSEAMKAGTKVSTKTPATLTPITAPQEREIVMTEDQTTAHNLAKEIASGLALPDSIKKQIFSSVEMAVKRLIRDEVNRCFEEQISKIKKMSAEELVRSAA